MAVGHRMANYTMDTVNLLLIPPVRDFNGHKQPQ